MDRRTFISLIPGAALVAASAKDDPMRSPIRAICFDLFTLFDPRSVVKVAQRYVPAQAAELCDAWRVRQFEYSWLRVAGAHYADFGAVTEEALVYAAHARRVTLSPEARDAMVAAYSQLDPWPDARAHLQEWKAQKLQLAPLSNYAPAMIEKLLTHAGFDPFFDALISTDRARTFKPDPRAYALGMEVLGRRREEIAFAAFGAWDAVGAAWFGYPTYWVNRLGVPREELGIAADATGPDLSGLAAFVRNR